MWWGFAAGVRTDMWTFMCSVWHFIIFLRLTKCYPACGRFEWLHSVQHEIIVVVFYHLICCRAFHSASVLARAAVKSFPLFRRSEVPVSVCVVPLCSGDFAKPQPVVKSRTFYKLFATRNTVSLFWVRMWSEYLFQCLLTVKVVSKLSHQIRKGL